MTEVDDIARLRVPPHSAEAEQSIIGGLLLDNRAWDRVGGIVAEGDFYNHQHRLLYSVIGGMINAGHAADVITVIERLDALGKADECGGMVYLNALAQSVPSAANIRRYGELVRERAMLRKLVAAADDMATRAFNTEGRDSAAILDEALTKLSELQRRGMRKEPRAIADIAIERTQHYEDLADGKVVAGWRTHIPRLTYMLNGGLRAGSLYILAARPSVGKSSFAQDLGLHFAQDGLTTLFLSQEMPDTEVADRGVANFGRLSFSDLMTGKMERDNWTRATEAMERLAKLPFYVDDQAALTLQDIRNKARTCKGLKVLFLDYLQLCTSARKDSNRNNEVGEISRGLKALAKDMGIAVVALSQLNRKVETRANSRPNLSDLRDSGEIEQDADVVLFLWPVREHEEQGRRVIGCAIDKNRQGRLGEVGLDFFGDLQQWSESLDDIKPVAAPKKGKFE